MLGHLGLWHPRHHRDMARGPWVNIYIAGAFESQARLKPLRDRVQALGHEVVSTWLDEGSLLPPTPEESWAYAIRDLGEVRVCDLLILDTFDVNERGGREFEAGVAFNGGATLGVLRVGPSRNVFHELLGAYETWEAMLEWLGEQD